MRRLLLLVILVMSLQPAFARRGETEKKMEALGFVDLSRIDSTFVIDLMYARSDNFVGTVLYGDLTKAYLHVDAAKALVKAQKLLSKERNGYRLKICDAARPMSVQRKMYDVVKNTPMVRYVSNPSNGGGLHNYGLAVDVTIVDDKGCELPMGTKVDHLGPEANIDKEDLLVKKGVITDAERRNRLLLRRVMTTAGFKALKSEWWHFNFVSRNQAKLKYKVIDF